VATGIFSAGYLSSSESPLGLRLAHAGTGALLWIAGGHCLRSRRGVFAAQPNRGHGIADIGSGDLLFAEGFLEFILGFRLRPVPGSGWLFFDGVVTVLLGHFDLVDVAPQFAWVLGTLLGVRHAVQRHGSFDDVLAARAWRQI